MNAQELIIAITALSLQIADAIPDNDELNTLASIFTQLGETLETIVMQRIFMNKQAEQTQSLQQYP